MLKGFHNGEVENLLYLPEYKMYLSIDYDGVNIYDEYENYFGSYPTEEEAIEALRENERAESRYRRKRRADEEI